jgi:hypothetical protein
MILGFSHFTLSTNDLMLAVNHLGGMGYRVDFVETGILNSKEKAPLLRHYHSTHDIAFLRGNEVPSVELINHYGDICYKNENIWLVCRSAEPIASWSRVGPQHRIFSEKYSPTIQRIYGQKPDIFYDCVLGANIFWLQSNSSESSGIISVAVLINNTVDIEKWLSNERFFKRTQKDLWRLQNPSQTLSVDIIFLQQTDEAETFSNFLDGAGCSCLAFHGRHVDPISDQDEIRCKTTPTFGLFVNRKWLKIQFLTIPNFPIIEVIEK